MTEKIFDDFVEYFNKLPQNEKYKLGSEFNKRTGGKLSPNNNPLPVCVAMIKVDIDGEIKLLGIKRGIPPFVGGVAFPGGFQEGNETATDAAARELFEETGIKTSGEDYEIFGNPLLSPTNNELKFFVNKHVFGKEILDSLVLSEEVQGFVLIDSSTELCFPFHQQKARTLLEQEMAPTPSRKNLRP